jgi:hypothetical protein
MGRRQFGLVLLFFARDQRSMRAMVIIVIANQVTAHPRPYGGQ